MNGKRGRESMADMNDYMQAIIKALQAIHVDNVMIMSMLANSAPDSIEVKKIVGIFDEAIEGVLKQK